MEYHSNLMSVRLKHNYYVTANLYMMFYNNLEQWNIGIMEKLVRCFPLHYSIHPSLQVLELFFKSSYLQNIITNSYIELTLI